MFSSIWSNWSKVQVIHLKALNPKKGWGAGMYLACRHIKPGGERCKSPALKGHAFCYYHARLHSTTKLGVMDDVKLPVPEDFAAIQESLGTIFQAILNSRIDSKKTAQLLWGLQIASNNLPRKPIPAPKTVPSVTRSKNGDELAPVINVCNPWVECKGCKDAKTCDRYFDFDALVGNSKADDAAKDKPALTRADCIDANGVITNPAGYRRLLGYKDDDDDNDDDDDDDDDDGFDIKEELGTIQVLKTLEHTLEIDDRPSQTSVWPLTTDH
jgi:hypothetical protein